MTESMVNIRPSNRLGLDYAREAAQMPAPPAPIVDVHTHINGLNAARIYQKAADLYGIDRVYSMTQLEEVPAMRAIFGDRIRFIAVPRWSGPPDQKAFDMGKGFIERIGAYHKLGCRIVKFWCAPRAVDIGKTFGDPYFMRLSSPSRMDVMKAASDLGMIFMVHIGDPDTWFLKKYAEAATYGTKRQQYEPLEEMLERFAQPWIAAHMGGSPEDFEFLSGLMQRHPNLHLDTSAAKWMIRELSKHARDEIHGFLRRFQGRVMFGSDIVTMDEHLAPVATDAPKQEMAAKANSLEDAFDLYASRYWALRKLWESDVVHESPIADPDLHMVDPERYSELDAPVLRGQSLPRELLQSLYHDAAAALLDPLHDNSFR